MIGYRKKAFERAHRHLQTLRTDPSDMQTLGALQQLLVREITTAELKIRGLKTELQRANVDGSTDQTQYIIRRLEGLRQCAYLFRCFGDAIAFLYLDKYALKQTFFNTHNTNQKQGAGFLIGKDGLKQELRALEVLLERKIPALLSDLTNTIRHGDICVLIGPDPHLIEIKAGRNLDRRGKRQKRQIETLHSFFQTDEADNLRGYPRITRRVFQSVERDYAADLNSCISEALRQGHSVRSPERGLHYVAIAKTHTELEHILAPLCIRTAICFSVNEYKTRRAWAPYSPFTLSLVGWDELWAFAKGQVVVFAFVEVSALCELAIANGCSAAELIQDNESSPGLRIKFSGSAGVAEISSFVLQRIGLEFLSPAWLIESSCEILSEHLVQQD